MLTLLIDWSTNRNNINKIFSHKTFNGIYSMPLVLFLATLNYKYLWLDYKQLTIAV